MHPSGVFFALEITLMYERLERSKNWKYLKNNNNKLVYIIVSAACPHVKRNRKLKECASLCVLSRSRFLTERNSQKPSGQTKIDKDISYSVLRPVLIYGKQAKNESTGNKMKSREWNMENILFLFSKVWEGFSYLSVWNKTFRYRNDYFFTDGLVVMS